MQQQRYGYALAASGWSERRATPKQDSQRASIAALNAWASTVSANQLYISANRSQRIMLGEEQVEEFRDTWTTKRKGLHGTADVAF